jgi:hypothetical protein
VAADGDRPLVEVAGKQIPAEGEGARVGDEVFPFFRPEWVRVGEGPFTAEIARAEYQGDRWELETRFEGLPLVLVVPSGAAPHGRARFAIRNARALPRADHGGR